MSKVIFRSATEEDSEQLAALLKECFGEFALEDALSWIEGRYMIAEDLEANKIVAMSGIVGLDKSKYNGYEVQWSCTNPKYRKKGYMVKILRLCEANLPKDRLPIYCECWRIRDNRKVNIASVMKHLGLHRVISTVFRCNSNYNKRCSKCIYKEPDCYCCRDLFMKERG